ncbi:MAG: AmmeMemoRadiSam system protein B, partial [Burkholderiaceae bacterium]|nr:AmmeMemoRadiSam system protein B [Burkholderiaceae bacterium]
MRTASTVRPAAVAGAFYPADPMQLSQQLRALLAGAAAQAAPPKVLIVPHAGYVYSGAMAAQAYSRLAPLRWTVRRVELLGPCHRVAVRGVALPSCGFFETPLGRVEVDRAAVAALTGQPGVAIDDRPHAQDHALEVQLPFLQAVLEQFSLVPIQVGQIAPEPLAALIEQLWGGPETLIVVSSDLSHYLPYAQAQAVDGETAARILEGVPDLTHAQACGATAINALLQIARRRHLAPALLGVCNSGDTAGERNRVVGYAACTFSETFNKTFNKTSSESAQQQASADPPAPPAEADIGAVLIAQARYAIDQQLGRPAPPPPDGLAPLDAPGACFVTLTIGGALRGCIGALQATRTLREDVRANAVAAATRDPRFTPLSAAEWARTTVEVSVLSPVHYTPCPDQATALARIQPGRDGVVLRGERGTRSATFLPAVWRQLPQPADFLRHLLNKGGFSAWP